jgi:cytochrome c-type biogenesis protein CcmH/NrfG
MRLDLGALVQFQASLLLNPEAAEFSNLGQLYAIRGEFDEAVQAYRHSLRLRPN